MDSEAASRPSSEPLAQKPERIKARRAKKLMISLLEKYPIVEAACNKIGISRSTHYQWIKIDFDYRVKIEAAMALSISTVNDIAESNIINGVKRGDFKETRFWLAHRHSAYKAKAEIIRIPEGYSKDVELSPEAQEDMERSIDFATRGLKCNKPHVGETDIE